jgi:hypothetical protein
MNDRATILQQLQLASRLPFQQELAKLLACAPDEEAIRAWAQKNVDRWAQSIAILSKASGVADRVEVSATTLVGLAVEMETWSDARYALEERKIEQQLRALQERLDRATLPADDDDKPQRPN